MTEIIELEPDKNGIFQPKRTIKRPEVIQDIKNRKNQNRQMKVKPAAENPLEALALDLLYELGRNFIRRM